MAALGAVRARNGLSRYSLSNQLLIAMARSDATFVAGFRAWLELGYCVREGERAIRIMAPMPISNGDGDDGEDDQPPRVLFKAVSVFDAAHYPLPEPLRTFATSIEFRVSFEALSGTAGGWCDPKGQADRGRRQPARQRIGAGPRPRARARARL